MLNVFVNIMDSRTWQSSGLFPSPPLQCFYSNVLYFLMCLLYITYVEEMNYIMLPSQSEDLRGIIIFPVIKIS